MYFSQDAMEHMGKVSQWLRTAPEVKHRSKIGNEERIVGTYYVSEVKISWYGENGEDEEVQGVFSPDDFGGYDFHPQEP